MRAHRPPTRASLGLVLGVAVLGLLAPGAAAERVRLRSGAVYEAEAIEVRGEALVLRLRLGGGAGRASFPFASIDPGDLARILAERTAPEDAAGHLAIARLALEAGRHAEASERARRATALDPTLGPALTGILGAIRGAEARAALTEIELDLRLARPAAAAARARALLELGVPVVPPEVEAAKARLLLALAEAALVSPADAPLAPTPPAPLAAPSPAWADAIALEARASAAREHAANPALPPAARETLLSGAAVDLLDARRLLLALPAGTSTGLVARLERLRDLLVATWLDLADLARRAGQPAIALDRVQAALILEPESQRAWDLRRWVEGDLAAPWLAAEAGPPVWVSPNWFSSGPRLGPCGPACAGPYAGGFALRLGGHGRGSGGGAHHHAGQRR